MDEPTRTAWRTPELIVLVRGGAEETVLNGCKGYPYQGIYTGYYACQSSTEGCVQEFCSAYAAS